MAKASWVHPEYKLPRNATVEQIKARAKELGHVVVFRAQLPQKYNTRPASVARYIKGAVQEGMHVISTTESNEAMRVATDQLLGPRWEVTRRGEYLILWPNAMFQEARGYIKYHRITKVYFIQRWRDLWVHSRKLKHKKTGRVYRTDVGHPPATVQDGDKFHTQKNPDGVRAWKTGLNRQGRRMRGRAKRLLQDFVADFNVDLHRRVWRKEVKDRLGYPTIYDTYTPPWGTHAAKRLIDGAAGNTEVVAMGQLDTDRPGRADHGNFWYAFKM